MNLFSKNLEHLLGASYLSGAAEALVKSKSLNSQQFEKNLDELKQVRKSLLQKAESDGHSEPKRLIEGAKKVAYNVLKKEIPTTKKNGNNILKDVEEPTTQEPTTQEPNSQEPNSQEPNIQEPPTETSQKNSNMFGLTNTSKNSTNITNSSTSELMPLDNESTSDVISTTNLPTKPPPPVLQLGGKKSKSKKSKRSKSKSRKHRK